MTDLPHEHTENGTAGSGGFGEAGKLKEALEQSESLPNGGEFLAQLSDKVGNESLGETIKNLAQRVGIQPTLLQTRGETDLKEEGKLRQDLNDAIGSADRFLGGNAERSSYLVEGVDDTGTDLEVATVELTMHLLGTDYSRGSQPVEDPSGRLETVAYSTSLRPNSGREVQLMSRRERPDKGTLRDTDGNLQPGSQVKLYLEQVPNR